RGLIDTPIAGTARLADLSDDSSRVAVVTPAGLVEVRRGDGSAPRVIIPSPIDLSPAGLDADLSADGSRVLVFDKSVPGIVSTASVADAANGPTLWVNSPLHEFAEIALSPDGATVYEVPLGRATLESFDVATGDRSASIRAANFGPAAFNGSPDVTLDGQYIDIITSGGVARLEADTLRLVRSIDLGDVEQGDVAAIPGTD